MKTDVKLEWRGYQVTYITERQANRGAISAVDKADQLANSFGDIEAGMKILQSLRAR
jgi:hypothetical protein